MAKSESKLSVQLICFYFMLKIIFILINNPCKLLGIEYFAPRITLKVPHFLLCTHDYEHVDLFCMAREARRWYAQTGIKTLFVVADKLHNRAFCSTIHRGGCIIVKSRTTEKVIRMLTTHHVCMFIYRQATGRGAYYITRGIQVPALIVQIQTNRACSTLESGSCISESVVRTLGCTVRIKYRKLNPIVSHPDKYMFLLKKRLYNE